MRIAPRSVALRGSDGHELLFSYGSGPVVYDSTGRDYLDFVCGFGPVVLGHDYPGFLDEVSRLASSSVHMPGYGVLHQELVSSFPLGDFASAGFFKSSSESVAAAIRLARMRSGRESVIQAGFIGWLDGQLAPGIAWHRPPLARGTSGNPLIWADLDLDVLRARLEERDIACVVLDAYQCVFNSGTASSFLSAIYSACRNTGTKFVLDETKTSGRVGLEGIWPTLGFLPDLIVVGKSIANGLPLSLLIDTSHDRDTYLNARIGGTFSKESVSVAGAIVARRMLSSDGGIERLKRIGSDLCTRLNLVISSLGLSDEVELVPRFDGAMFDIELASGTEYESGLLTALSDAGVLMLLPHPNFVMLAHDSVLTSGLLEERFESALTRWM